MWLYDDNCTCTPTGLHTQVLSDLLRPYDNERDERKLPIAFNKYLKIYLMLNCALLITQEEWDNKKKRPWFGR